MRHVTDPERRARLARRHAVAPAHRVDDAVAATRAMTVLHATEPATVHLSVAARVDGWSTDDTDRCLHDERSLVKQLAMRRTLFVFPRDLLPAAWGSASARVAASEQRRTGKNLVAAGLATDADAWFARVRADVLAALDEQPDGLPASELRARVPALGLTVPVSPGTRWGGDVPVAPRVLGWLGARGDVVRGANAGHWRTSRPCWATMASWLGDVPEPLPEAAGYAELLRGWLRTFGPGTEADLVWWLGATRTAVRRALADVQAVEVSLDGGGTGWLLPDDLQPEPPVEPWAALLPVLDPTTMGWREREFHLDPSAAPHLFDRQGNAGTTAWVDGRVVGCWVQDDDAVVRVALHEDVGTDARTLLEAEAERLTAWLAGTRVSSVYKSPLMLAALQA